MIIADLKSDGVRMVVIEPAPGLDIESEVARVTGMPLTIPYTKEQSQTLMWEGCFVVTCTFIP